MFICHFQVLSAILKFYVPFIIFICQILILSSVFQKTTKIASQDNPNHHQKQKPLPKKREVATPSK